MLRIWCGECGTFVVGELKPGIGLLDQGHVLSPSHIACEGCERQPVQQDTEMPTILRVSLKPFCPACGGGLHMQRHDEITTIWVEQEGTPQHTVFAEIFVLVCSWCGKMLEPSDIIWREREQEER